jgi:hypothetical protein
MSSESDSFSPLVSVVFLGIAGLVRNSVSEQARLRSQIDAAVAAGIAGLNEEDRVVLDSPDGAAIVVLGSPAAALHAAQRAMAARGNMPLGAAINHGPVALASGAYHDTLLVGDAIEAAATIAGAAQPDILLVSRSYRDALAAEAPHLAEKLHPAGVFTDARVRAHELFSPDSATLRAKARRQFMFGALACVAILSLGVGARIALQSYLQSRQPAVLEFDVRPPADIHVDGVLKGRTPALSRLQVSPGVHSIEIRSGKFPPHIIQVDLAPGEQMQLKHSFITPAQKRPTLLDRLKFWQ